MKSQSIYSIECPEFRELLMYLNPDLDDEDIPHRTKLTEEILRRYKTKREELWKEMKVSILQCSHPGLTVGRRKPLAAFRTHTMNGQMQISRRSSRARGTTSCGRLGGSSSRAAYSCSALSPGHVPARTWHRTSIMRYGRRGCSARYVIQI